MASSSLSGSRSHGNILTVLSATSGTLALNPDNTLASRQYRMMLDTQIVSYAFRGRTEHPMTAVAISSVVASEFLLAYRDGEPTRAAYYVAPHDPRTSRHGPLDIRLHNKLSRPRSHRRFVDGIRIDFDSEFPTRVEYNRIGLAAAINLGDRLRLSTALASARHPRQRQVLERFDFLVDHGVECVSLTNRSISIALGLLQAFMHRHTPKANFHNSFNDLLILAAAVDRRTELRTVDGELTKFVCSYYGLSPARLPEAIGIDFRQLVKSTPSKESKGYVNRGWRVDLLGNQGAERDFRRAR